MQKMFGLILIIALIWFGLSAYTGDGMGGIDLEGWLDPIGGERDAEGEVMEFSEPELASDVLRDYDPDAGDDRGDGRREGTGRMSRSKAESVPQAMRRRVKAAYQQSYDRVE